MPETKESPSLKYEQELSGSMDYSFLRREGIRFVQELAGKIWTDYNDHDPGVTILEQLCFALTDIAYRTNTDIETLLFSGKTLEERSAIASSNSLYVPEEILLSGNVTLQDNALLFLDRLTNINNIWFKKVEDKETNGLYDVYVQPLSNLKLDKQIERSVRELFSANRRLCEDINRVIVMQPEDLEIQVNVELYEEYTAEEVLAEIYFMLDCYFNRKVQYDSLETLLEKGMSYEQVFDRPSFDANKGFINHICLEEYQTAFSFSKIQTILAGIKGVRKVQDLVVRKNGIKIGGEQILIENGNFVSLSAILEKVTAEKPSIIIKKNNVRIDYNIDRVRSLYQQKVTEATRKYTFNSYLHKPQGKRSMDRIASYNSVQTTFPITYGIGNYGLPSEAGPDRKVYARQLQAYLLFFDQVLLNHLAQLKNIPHLFSIHAIPENKVTKDEGTEALLNKEEDVLKEKENKEWHKTYFEQYPDMIPDINELVNSSLRDKLTELLDDSFYERKNRMLDHFLARFSERFVDRAYHNLHTIYGIQAEDVNKTLVELKCSFLKQYLFLSQYKNKAYNYNLPVWNGKAVPEDRKMKSNELSLNIYPFKKKIFLLLNLPQKNEGMVSLVIDYSGLKTQPISEKERKDRMEETSGKKQEKDAYYKSYKENNASKITFVLPGNQSSIDNLVYYGNKKDNYSIVENKEGGTFTVFFNATAHNETQALGEYDSFAQAETVIRKLTEKFSAMNRNSEGFHVVEHILLRPVLEDQFEIEITIDKGKNVLMNTIMSDTYDECKKILGDSIISGSHKENFFILETFQDLPGKMAGYEIILKDKKTNDLLKLTTSFSSKFIAQTYIEEKLVPFFKEMSNDKSFIPSSVQLVSVKNKLTEQDNFYGSDLHSFYNSQISLVLPDWLPRFNEPDFQALLNHSLCQCLPAHVGVNLVWKNKKEMQEFEKTYVEWMRLSYLNTRNDSNPDIERAQGRIKDRKERQKAMEEKTKLDKVAAELIKQIRTGKR